MKSPRNVGILRSLAWFAVVAALLAVQSARVKAFSLLGPYEDWMQPTNRLRMPSDIGGPMKITEGYRWNVPVVTYGFDQSFLDFFGSNGVAAVESAIKILNDLPPASDLVLSNFPYSSERPNWTAELLFLVNLKSATLCVLIEQLGLAQPARSMFVVRRWDPFLTNCPYCYYEYPWQPGTIPFYIQMRNFDPSSLCPSTWLDGTHCSGEYIPERNDAFVIPFPIDPLALAGPAVAEGLSEVPFGFYTTGLTYDDAGGLRFLLSRTNVNYEFLLPDVRAVNPHRRLVNGAWRPGIEKISFVRQACDSHSRPVAMTFRFWDAYVTNGILARQHVKRVVTQPDFLFCAGDDGPNELRPGLYARSGTRMWVNNAALNGDPYGSGPGVIQPPVRITFQKLGPEITTGPLGSGPPLVSPNAWGSFDGSTNQPVVYPTAAAHPTADLSVWFRLCEQPLSFSVRSFVFHAPVLPGGTAALQSSSNLVDWVSLVTVTNTGVIVDWEQWGTALPQQFFRVSPQ